MKTSNFMKSIIAVVVLIFVAEFSFAGISNPKEKNDLKTVMKTHVVYPEFAKENNLTGFVVVAFYVDANGGITVKEINASSMYFQQYIENKLKELVLENPATYSGKTQYYRFDFQLIND